MRRLVLAALTVGLLAAPAVAEADGTISAFKVRDTGSRIVHRVTVCLDHPHTVRFVTYLETEDSWPSYQASYVDRDRAGCWTHSLSRSDIFTEGFWYGRVKVVIGSQIRSTGWREFYNS